MGRPKVEFTNAQWGTFKKLCAMQCTEEEIAGFLKVSIDTLRMRCKEKFFDKRENPKTGKMESVPLTFTQAYKRFSADGKVSLRRVQFQHAVKKKNTSMMIWLGQQMLGQSNRHHQTGGGQANDEREVEYDIHEKLYKE